MINYANQWKKDVNFQQITYGDFTSTLDKKKYYFSEKMDGQLSAFIYSKKNNECFFLSTSDIEIHTLPVLEEYKKLLDSNKNIQSTIIVGELCAFKNNQILKFEESQSIIKTYKKGNNSNFIYHFPYDVYYVNDKKISFKESLVYIDSLKRKKLNRIKPVNHIHGNIDELKKLWNESIGKNKSGIEGIVVRNDLGKALKIKPQMSFDMVIVGVGSKLMKSWERNQISYLVPAFIDHNGLYRLSSKIGTGFTFDERKFFYNYAMKHNLGDMNKNSIFIVPEIIAEVQFDQYRMREMLTYEFVKNEYILKGKKQSVTLRNPRFLRIRDDKKLNSFDCGLRQIPEFPLKENYIDKKIEKYLI